MEWLTWLLANYQLLLTSIIAVLTAVIAVALIVPGEQPEKMIQGWVDFLSKFSRK